MTQNQTPSDFLFNLGDARDRFFTPASNANSNNHSIMKYDLLYAMRMIKTHPWHSAAIVLTLALGIGMNTMVFTLVNAVLFKPVPVPNGDRLVTIRGQHFVRGYQKMRLSYPDFFDYREQSESFEALAAVRRDTAVISENGIPAESFEMGRVTEGLFSMLETPPILGRTFAQGEHKVGATPVVIIGYDIWQERYSGNADVIGKAIRFNGTAATIVGVMPERFKFPNEEEFWVPLIPTGAFEQRDYQRLEAFGILNENTSMEAANAELATIAQRIANEFPDTRKNVGAHVLTFHDTYNDDSLGAIFLLMLAAVGLVLLIACSNVANMMLGRAIERRHEMSVRAAVGATPRHIIRQLLSESLLLSIIGGLLGLCIAVYGVHLFNTIPQEGGLPFWIQFEVDYRTFAYFAVVTIFSGIIFGLAPALDALRTDLIATLKIDTRASGDPHGGKLSGTLVILQFAMTLVLLTFAGLMVRSVLESDSQNDFVPTNEILTFRINLTRGTQDRYNNIENRFQFYNNLIERLQGLPGVVNVSAASGQFGISDRLRKFVETSGALLDDPANAKETYVFTNTIDYHSTINLPLLSGRSFTERDGPNDEKVAIVTPDFAKIHWPQQSPIDKRFRFLSNSGPGDWMRVVGVFSNVIINSSENLQPVIFTPCRQGDWDNLALLVRFSQDPHTQIKTVRDILQEIDQDLPVSNLMTLQEAKERNGPETKILGILFTIFAFVALAMGSVGIYSTVAKSTASRTKEIGIRIALGAQSFDVLRAVLPRGVKQLAIGLVIGLAIALLAARLVGPDLGIGISPNDPVVFATVFLLLAMVGLFACWLPARKATRISPSISLRGE